MKPVKKHQEADENALTEKEIQFLRREGVPSEIKNFIARSHQDMGVRAAAYRKIAAAARAEAEAIFAVRAVAALRGEVDLDADYRREIANLKDDRAALEAANTVLRSRVEALTAAPAMTVHSDD